MDLFIFCFVCWRYLEMICSICLICLWRLCAIRFRANKKTKVKCICFFFFLNAYTSPHCIDEMVYIDTVTHLIPLDCKCVLFSFQSFCWVFVWRLSICTPKRAIRHRIECNSSHIIKSTIFISNSHDNFLLFLQYWHDKRSKWADHWQINKMFAHIEKKKGLRQNNMD